MKLVLTLLALMPMLWSCSTGPTRPAVDASLYHLDLDVDVDAQVAEFEPDVAKGGGSGMLRGAGMGIGGCIYVGASLDGASNGGAFPLGTALGIVASPACAVLGSVFGGGLAETKEDVANRTAAINAMAVELGYPGDLAQLLSEDLKSGPIYHIAQTTGTEWQSSDAGASDDIAPVTPTKITTQEVFDPESKKLVDKLLPDPQLRPSDPNALIRLRITKYGFEGKGVDPKLPLRMTATLCVTQYATGEALAFGRMTATSKAMKLEDWAALETEDLAAETQSLVHLISQRAQAIMGRQVRLEHKASCGKSTFLDRISTPMSHKTW